MKALVCTHGGRASAPREALHAPLAEFVALRDLDPPRPKGGQVVIEVELAAVNPSDDMFARGLYGLPREKGAPPGFEGVGRVVETGGGLVARTMRGKRVAFFAQGSGSWAERALTGAASCIPVGDALRAEDAAGFLVNPFTAWALDELVAERGAKSFVMSAAGSQMGKFLVSLAAERGRRPICTVRRDEQIEPLRALGAAHVLNEETDGFDREMRDVLEAERPSVFLDAVAGPRQARIHERMGEGARWVVYGRLASEPPALERIEQLIFQRKRIEGFWLSDWFGSASLVAKARASRAIRRRFATGQWRTDVAATVRLDEGPERLEAALRESRDGKVFLKP